ncbi:isopropylmalate isomerase [Alkalihalobacillus alcalophilus ATCC 27647 = CGMCC 1.3604]|uniref:3-isopropylmalate dehydratase small subunit n=1 Tax=Alkalihalobacillus alcalophilus ATCC 27647 = CGMCC 1.3604 TaxID=1218173 RepID=A0A094WMK7_ALKAL|nr:3-isopropylmalate dehydratase small subunit [Alkalihalobacillus alcalophilus]KGA98101.1 isopropylmalate isomerase [Alkalihalobacillus alcalophilus ATCC 27647 = CGMCC 1.3604]MED1561438.1 3-isopropylmalate dehydratase small subunit [Alkalihalobacillus alcalophilus]THG88780.1 isopropylmalate isomerase [Alkalihalobacillus alcalophilus ATCC 27647 = CGMCC 1.3604]
MEPLVIHEGKIATLNRVNVDTDQIIPKQFLKRVERTGFGQFLFYDWRFLKDGQANPHFELNKPHALGASILVAAHNFGCGSSREHAPWALHDYGFKVVIAPSFADIFYNNCVKNGMLPIRLNEEQTNELLERGAEHEFELKVDLKMQKITGADFDASFEIDPYWKEMLLNGWDEIGLTLRYETEIAKFEQTHTV